MGPLWTGVVQPPFIKCCVDGSITEAQFHTWLIQVCTGLPLLQSAHMAESTQTKQDLQDYHYVIAFTRFTGQILAEAPIQHMDALLSGLSALSGELSWFRVRTALLHVFLACIAHCPAWSLKGAPNAAGEGS